MGITTSTYQKLFNNCIVLDSYSYSPGKNGNMWSIYSDYKIGINIRMFIESQRKNSKATNKHSDWLPPIDVNSIRGNFIAIVCQVDDIETTWRGKLVVISNSTSTPAYVLLGYIAGVGGKYLLNCWIMRWWLLI